MPRAARLHSHTRGRRLPWAVQYARASSNELQLERQIEDLVEAQWAERRKLQMLEVRERNGAVCGPEEFAALQAKQQAVLQQLAASRANAPRHPRSICTECTLHCFRVAPLRLAPKLGFCKPLGVLPPGGGGL